MYPRVNRNRQNIKPKQGQKDLSDDIRNEEINTGAGNEAALLGNIVSNISNEANEADLSGRIENLDQIDMEDLQETGDGNTVKTLKRTPAKKSSPKNVPAPKAEAKKKPGKDLAGVEQFLDEVKEEDVAKATEDMEPVKGMNFEAQTLPARKNKPGKIRKFLSRLSYYSGKTVGTLLGFLGNLVAFPYSIYKLYKRSSTRDKNKANATERNRNEIPGWNGAQFEETVRNDLEPDIDFRKVPAVWSYETADQALDTEGNPRQPVLSIYVNQPDETNDRTVDEEGNTGHTGIGIEYSRYSRTTGSWERYNLRYGFYPAGGMGSTSAHAQMGYGQAVIPGQLIDEKDYGYTISRSYPATAKQVNAVMKASVPYADKGYNNYTRNCTSFAKAMMLDVAHIPAGKEIFARDEIRLSAKSDAQIFGASMGTLHTEAGMEADLSKLINGEDISYMNFGGKRMSSEEYKNYRNSLSFWKARRGKADSPNAVAENIRRLKGKNVGVVGKYARKTDENGQGIVDVPGAKDLLRGMGLRLKTKIEKMVPTEQIDDDELTIEYWDIMNSLDNLGQPIEKIDYSRPPETFSREELRKMRTEMSGYVVNLNKLLFKYYKNDKRIHQDVLNLISYMNEAIVGLDDAYRTVSERDDIANGDLGTLRQETTKYSYNILTNNSDTEVAMTPSLFEAYLQIYKSPREAVQKYGRYRDLQRRRNNGGNLSEAEGKEFDKLKRIRTVAAQFDRSHRYMLEKGSYSQQDIDYAFELQKKEKDGVRSPELTEDRHFSSEIYKSLFLEKVFGGMKERFTQFVGEDGQKSEREVEKWLENDLAECIRQKKDEMTRIVRGIVKASEYPTEDSVSSELRCMIAANWINRLFTNRGEKALRDKIRNAWKKVGYYGPLGKELGKLVEQVLAEQPKKVEEDEEED